jgi:hypothetical protein
MGESRGKRGNGAGVERGCHGAADGDGADFTIKCTKLGKNILD